MNTVMMIISLVIACICAPIDIGLAIRNYKNEKYFTTGVSVMFALYFLAHIICFAWNGAMSYFG